MAWILFDQFVGNGRPLTTASVGILITALSASFSGVVAALPTAAILSGYFLVRALVGEEMWEEAILESLIAFATALIASRLYTLSRATLEERTARLQLSGQIDQLDAIVWVAEPQPFRYVSVSKAAERILGYPARRWVEDPNFWEELVHPDDRLEAVKLRNEAAALAVERRAEYRVTAADGRTVWLSDVALPIKEGRGRSPKLIGRIVDITHEREREDRLNAVLAINRAMTEARSIDEVWRKVLVSLCQALGWKMGAVWVLNIRGDKLICRDVWAPDPEDVSEFTAACLQMNFEKGVGLPGRVWESQAPHWVPDVVVDPNFPRATQAAACELHGAVAFPAVGSTGFLCVFEFFSGEIQDADEELIEMLDSIGGQMGQFFERREAEKQVYFQKALLEAQSESAIDGILVVSQEGKILYANQKFFEQWRIPPQSRQDDAETLRQVLSQLSSSDDALLTIQRLYQDLKEEFRSEVTLKDSRVFDMWSAPLSAESEHQFGRAWFFRDVTDERRSREALEASRNRLRFLSEATAKLVSSISYEETLQRVATIAVPELSDWCALDIKGDDGSLERVVTHHPDPARIKWAKQLTERYPTDPDAKMGPPNVIRTGRSELYPDIDMDLLKEAAQDEAHLEELTKIGLTSAMVVPLIVRGEVLGAMTLVSDTSGRRYSEEDVSLAEALARRAAHALHNARQFKLQSHIADTLQQSLIPSIPPDIPGMKIGTRFMAAGDAYEVGGDFFDVIQYGNRWAAVLGDVSGKGADAARLAGLVRNTMRAEAMQEREPGRVMSLVNEALYTQSGEIQFCTAVYAKIEPTGAAARVTLVSAGHPPAFIMRAGGGIEQSESVNLPLGLQQGAQFEELFLDLNPGDSLLIYTDGVTECRSNGEMFGEERLAKLVHQFAGMDPQELVDAIFREVSKHCDTPQDDIALMALGVPK